MSFPEVSEARFSSGFRPVFVSFRAMLTWGLSDMRTQLWEQTVVMRKEFWIDAMLLLIWLGELSLETLAACAQL